MGVIRWIAVQVIRLGAWLFLRLEVTGMDRVPRAGAVLLVANHISFVDPLLLYVIMPRQVTGLAKAELWGNPISRLVARAWGTIPIRRGEMDLNAMRQALSVLHGGGMMGLAPEGTRSHHGRLLRARSGIVLLASRAPEAVLVPVAMYGQERLLHNLRRLRRTQVKVVVGQAFRLLPVPQRPTHEARQAMSDEVMLRIAALLPPSYHGVYAGQQLVECYTMTETEDAATRARHPCA
jgi:1-acyl-sn-glycerol-3-phosphate acyltransferase